MLLQILTQTPPWVFILFVALLWLGVQQMAPRTMPLRRATLRNLRLDRKRPTGQPTHHGRSKLAFADGRATRSGR